jgi:hypothetical protein
MRAMMWVVIVPGLYNRYIEKYGKSGTRSVFGPFMGTLLSGTSILLRKTKKYPCKSEFRIP